MSLELGKAFDRCYWLRLPFLTTNYNIGIFFNKRSTFLLFRVDPDTQEGNAVAGVKINMFKNLGTSRFCGTFLELHNYRKDTLDIQNQFNGIKDTYYDEIIFTLNETMNLYKVEYNDKTFYDNLVIYGLTMTLYNSEFVFLIAERQHIDKRLQKKIVRTTGVQIATSKSLEVLNEYYEESIKCGKAAFEVPAPLENPDTIKLEDLD